MAGDLQFLLLAVTLGSLILAAAGAWTDWTS